MQRPPPVRYAQTPAGKVAFQVVGDGPIDLHFATSGAWNLDLIWEFPPLERFLRRLASFSRLILCHPLGLGLSDPISLETPPTLEQWNADVLYAMDEIGSERVALVAASDFGPPGILFAAGYPDRVQALALLDSYATLRRVDDHPWGLPADALDRLTEIVVSGWGSGYVGLTLAPEMADNEAFLEWHARLERGTASPSTLRYIRETIRDMDVRGVLPSVQAPTLVISHAENTYVRAENGRYLAEHIPSARFVERQGPWGLPWLHDVDWTLDELESFFTGTRSARASEDRVLATLLFSDIVDSTRHAAAMGDERWRWSLDEHDAVVRREVARHRGRVIKLTGDGVLATFDGPARAIRCATAMREALRSAGLEIRSGLHTGEVELRDDDVGGIAVHIAARVMAAAVAGEVLVSGAVPPLVAGSGLEFEDRGSHELKGVPSEWQLLAVGAPTP